MEVLLELDILDFIENEDSIDIYTTPDNFLNTKETLEKEGYTNFIVTEVTMVPSNYITLDGETKERAINLIEELENIDDVQNIYHNLEL